MKLAGEQNLPAPRDRVWVLLNDPNRPSKLIPGFEKLDVLAPDEFAGTLNVGIAAVKGAYAANSSSRKSVLPNTTRWSSTDAGRQGFMRGSGTLDLLPKDGTATIVKYSGDIQIGGPLMQVGQRLIDSAAKALLGQFFAAAEAEFRAEASGTVARHDFFLNFWRYILRAIRSLFTRRS